MKKAIILILSLNLFFEYANAQSSFIQKRIYLPKSNTSDSRDVIETTPNNYVVMGFTLDSMLGNQLHQRLTLAGLDQNGSLTWRKSYGNNNFAYTPIIWSAGMVVRKSNFLYTATSVVDSNSLQLGVLLKINFNGDTVWQKKYYALSTQQVFFTSVAPSIDNGFLITGAIQTNTPTFNNHPTVALYLLKTDASGTKLWDKYFYKTNLDETQCGYKVIQESISKRIFVVGSQDNGSTSCSNLLVLDSLGNKITQRNFSGAAGGILLDIIKTSDGNLASVGGNNDFQQINSMNTTKSMLVKIDTAGNLIYKAEYDTLVIVNAFNSVRELSNGDLIIGGELGTLVQYGLGINDILRIIRTDKNGNLIWKKYFDNYTDNTNQDQLQGINLTYDSHIIFTSACVAGEPPPRSYTFYKTDTSSCDVNSIGCYNFTGIKEVKNQSINLSCYPNPSSNYSLVEFSGMSIIDPISVTIRNILGAIVFTEDINGFKSYSLNTSQYPEGIYYISVRTEKKILGEQKLIILR